MSEQPVWADMPRPHGISEDFWLAVRKSALEGDGAASRVMWRHYALYLRQAISEVRDQLRVEEHASVFVRTAQQISERVLLGEEF